MTARTPTQGASALRERDGAFYVPGEGWIADGDWETVMAEMLRQVITEPTKLESYLPRIREILAARELWLQARERQTRERQG